MSQYFPWAAFSALRAYTLIRSRVWMISVFILSMAPVGVNTVHLFVCSNTEAT
ncbi:hypothetical protein C8Q80DRAFT_1206032 [Daedaleopsis nitida]|nr:hypothetical protein C8Q80DRAFT_1206032 [Daedaleopsis nitida]